MLYINIISEFRVSMRKNNYIFTTDYHIEKDAEEVWRRVTDVESWPRIWKNFRYVAIQGNEDRIQAGSVVHCRVRAAMFYRIEFDVLINEIVPGKSLRVTCSGDIDGEGLWVLKSSGASVESCFQWKVYTDSLLLRFIEMIPLGKRFLRFNHRLVMEEGYRSFMRDDHPAK
jgi:hypothetical protein